MQPTNPDLNTKESRRFDPPAPEYDELVAYWAFVEKRLSEIRDRCARK